MKIPLQDIITKIKDHTGMDDAAIQQKINEKLTKLSGLVSKEGAAHILANELGVKLFEHTGNIKDVYPGMRTPKLAGRVIVTYDLREFQRKDGSTGHVGTFMMGDNTGTMRVVCWGDQAKLVNELSPGDVVQILEGIPKESRTGVELHVSKGTKVQKNPEGVEVPELKPVQIERKKICDLTEQDTNIEVLGTVVQVFEPKYFEVCPECGSRLRQAEEQWKCDKHGSKEVDYSYVINVFLDDGTESIRVALFRDQAEKILDKSKEDMLKFRTDPELFEPLKTELLGEQFIISGRAKNNVFFNRLEFVANMVRKATPQEVSA